MLVIFRCWYLMCATSWSKFKIMWKCVFYRIWWRRFAISSRVSLIWFIFMFLSRHNFEFEHTTKIRVQYRALLRKSVVISSRSETVFLWDHRFIIKVQTTQYVQQRWYQPYSKANGRIHYFLFWTGSSSHFRPKLWNSKIS